MGRFRKILIIAILLFIISACGANNNKKTEENQTNTDEQVSEIVSTRNIVVSKIVGEASVTHKSGEKLDAYEGMNLYDGDDVIVNKSSNVTLTIDSDKHLFADENSHFWLTATGDEKSSKTLIHLEAGSILCDIKEKLKDDETFDIQTASSTMSVRGTVFRVCLLNGKDNSVFDLVEVYDGKVWSSIDNTDDNVTLEPGQCALIRKNESKGDDAFYVVEEDLNSKFVEETGLNISLENADEQGNGALKISLENVPTETLSRLIEIIDEGTPLAIDKEEIQKVEETKKQEEAKEELIANHEHNYAVSSRSASTCVTNGVITYKCSICGETKTEYLPLAEHTPETVRGHSASCTENGKTDGVICSVCGKVLEAQSTIKASGHKDVLAEDGLTHKCSVCGKTLGVDELKYTITEIATPLTPSFTYDVDDDYVIFDIEISGAKLVFISKDTLKSRTVDSATINYVFKFPLSEITKSEPNYSSQFLYDGNEVDISDGAKATVQYYEDSIITTLADRFIDFKISSLPDSFNSTNATIRKIDGNKYKIEIPMTASATFTKLDKGNPVDGQKLPVNCVYVIELEYDTDTEKPTVKDDSTWTINAYCFNQILSSKIPLFVEPATCESFLEKVKIYANNEIPNIQ